MMSLTDFNGCFFEHDCIAKPHSQRENGTDITDVDSVNIEKREKDENSISGLQCLAALAI